MYTHLASSSIFQSSIGKREEGRRARRRSRVVMMKRMVILTRCQPPPLLAAAMSFGGCCGAGVRYRECRRNHAARMGGHAVDGCREFLAEGEEGTSGALRCAACGCHRSFHRRMVVQRCCCEDADTAAAATGRWDCSPESTASSTPAC